jgi:cobalamin biosynthesis protein CobT
MATNSTWPLVTVPDFEAWAVNMRQEATADVVGLTPFVTNANRVTWEEYSVARQGWIEESRELGEEFGEEEDSEDEDEDEEDSFDEDENGVEVERIYPKIFRFEHEEQEDSAESEDEPQGEIVVEDDLGLYAPIWQL